MTHVTSLRQPFPDLVDNTMVSCFDSCERKFHNEFLMRLAPLAISPDLHAGGAFSRGLEIARRSFYALDKTQPEALIDGVNAMITFWGAFEPPHNHPKTLDNMIGALDSYLQTYPFETDPYTPYKLSNGSPAVEFTFCIPTEVMHPQTGLPIMYGGRFDMMAVHSEIGLVIVDEKTTKAFGTTWSSQWGMRGQFIGYLYGAQQHGYDTSTFLIRGIAILKTKYNHLECLEQFPQWQLERWWQQLQRKLRRMVECWERNDWGYSYGEACTSYGGCMYLTTLCTSLDETSHYGQFQERNWNPLAKDPSWPQNGPTYETIDLPKELMK